jgi:hypothetical protein
MKDAGKREAVLISLCVVLILSLLYLVLLNRWGIRLWEAPLDYQRFGTWGEAIAGLATTGAVIVALATLLWQRAAQRSSDLSRKLEAETAVFHWLTSKEVRDEENKLISRLWDIRIHNSTVAPIYQWKIDFSSVPDHLCSRIKRPLLPGENVFNLPFLDDMEPSNMPEPALAFQGISERYWVRSASGLLEIATAKRLECAHLAVVTLGPTL